jgi:hypothetical protein
MYGAQRNHFDLLGCAPGAGFWLGGCQGKGLTYSYCRMASRLWWNPSPTVKLGKERGKF